MFDLSKFRLSSVEPANISHASFVRVSKRLKAKEGRVSK